MIMKNIEIPSFVGVLLDKLEQNGHEAYVVGGAVRSSLMGEIPHDYDVTTSATPDEMKAVFSDFRVIETGLKHGTLTVLSENSPVEITTYRLDGEYTDGRRPDAVSFTRSIEDDLARRDFTVNAMAYSEKRGLVDLFGGIKDIENKVIRTVGEPERRFAEDHLRILRALRFASRFGFEIHPETAAAMRKLAPSMKSLARERVYSEIKGMACGIYAQSVMNEYADVVSFVLDGFCGTALLGNADSTDPSVRLALASDGFESMDAAVAAIRSLRPDNKTFSVTKKLIELIFSPELIKGDNVIEYALNNGVEFTLFAADVMRAKNTELGVSARELIESALGRGACFDIKGLALKGEDLVLLGVRGSLIGDVLDELLRLSANGLVINEKSKLLEKAEEILGRIHE